MEFQNEFQMELEKLRSQEIKRKIIENTKQLIQSQSMVTIKDIAEASYVNIAAVNYHFGSKEQLLNIVINEVLLDLKHHIKHTVLDKIKEEPIEETLESLMTYIYTFSLENMGILNYLFLTKEIQNESSSLLIETFFTDNEFTRLVYESLAENLNIQNPKESFAKYMILFSSFSIPLFIQIAQMRSGDKMQIETFKDPEFRQYFISSILKMVKAQ
jgi:AcrR family transcriptional regulator